MTKQPDDGGVDAEWEAAEDEADRRDHVMWLNGFREHAAWEVTRAELRAADVENLRNIADDVFDIAIAGKSRTALIEEILASRELFRWGPS